MARPYSLDLRERVVSAVAEGVSCRDAARRFGVSAASAVKWCQRYRRTGSAASDKMGGHRPFALAGERDWLLGRIAEKPDLTLRALQAELAERGVVVSYYAVWHFFENEDVTFKKKPVRERAGPAGRGQEARALETVAGKA
jgi:transposase